MTEYNVEKMYTYLKGYITGAGFTESMKALGYAKEKHEFPEKRPSVSGAAGSVSYERGHLCAVR